LLGKSEYHFQKYEIKKFKEILHNYEQFFARDYPAFKKQEEKYCKELQTAIGNDLRTLLNKAEKYTRIPFKEKKVIIHPSFFFTSGGMGFRKENQEIVCICSSKTNETESTRKLGLLLHEAIHSVTNILKRESDLSHKLQTRYRTGEIFKNVRNVDKFDYGNARVLFNESFTRAVDRRIMVINKFYEEKIFMKKKMFGITQPLFLALKEDYEKSPYNYKDIKDFGTKWIKENLL
jgi:hypothetical protein